MLIYTYLAPERPEKPEKPEKYLYTPYKNGKDALSKPRFVKSCKII